MLISHYLINIGGGHCPRHSVRTGILNSVFESKSQFLPQWRRLAENERETWVAGGNLWGGLSVSH